MARAPIQLRVLTDNNVPDSIGDYLRRRGHSAHRVRGHMADSAPDQLVAMAALRANRILITQDKDFNGQRFQKPYMAALSRISLVGEGKTLKAAMKEHIHLIEAQWMHKVQTGAVRMIVHVQVGQIKFRT
jgi:predicted nuclease of predicted toxin-antitoxin system